MENMFKTRLKELRKAHKVTQREMGEYLGITTRGYQRYEIGDGYPDVPGLVALADYFGVTIDYLVGRSDEP